MGKLVSIIIPIYNVEEYLSNCLECLINQSYRNLEIILVNDGSQDKCGFICDSYAQRDSRIIVIHKENAGVSSARNKGLSAATGDFVVFIDSDDYVSIDYVEYLYNCINVSSADISACRSIQVKDEDRLIGFSNYNLEYSNKFEIYSSKIAIKKLLLGEINPETWSKMYRRKAIDKMIFREDIALGEDILFVYTAISNCEIICVSSEIKYFYLQRENSITNSGFNEKHLSLFISLYEIKKITMNKYPIYRSHYYFRFCCDNLFLLNILVSSEINDKSKEIEKIISENIFISMKEIKLLSITNLTRIKIYVSALIYLLNSKKYKKMFLK